MNNFLNNFGKLVSSTRRRKSIQLHELAEKTGISIETIEELESGNAEHIVFNDIYLLGNYLNINISANITVSSSQKETVRIIDANFMQAFSILGALKSNQLAIIRENLLKLVEFEDNRKFYVTFDDCQGSFGIFVDGEYRYEIINSGLNNNLIQKLQKYIEDNNITEKISLETLDKIYSRRN